MHRSIGRKLLDGWTVEMRGGRELGGRGWMMGREGKRREKEEGKEGRREEEKKRGREWNDHSQGLVEMS
jgi:hypothetical protein